VEEVDLDGHPGLLVRPPGARWLYVLAHGAGAGMRHSFLEDIAAALAACGVATLRWELPYMAAGRARPDPPAVAHAAVRAVWAAARARFGDLPMFAGGKSFGGRMTSGAHAEAPLAELRGIAFLGFPLHPPERPRPRVLERAEHLARTAPAPLLFVQGTRDELADLPRLRPVVAWLGQRAGLHTVAHADHGFDVLVRSGRTRPDVLAEIADAVAAWMARLAPAPELQDRRDRRIAPRPDRKSERKIDRHFDRKRDREPAPRSARPSDRRPARTRDPETDPKKDQRIERLVDRPRPQRTVGRSGTVRKKTGPR
jgi:predicted alpha/beta-hydrolase family hydrolase